MAMPSSSFPASRSSRSSTGRNCSVPRDGSYRDGQIDATRFSITTPEAERPPPPVPLPQKLGEGELRRGAGEASLALGPGGGGLREGLLLETLIQRRSAARSWGRGY